ncbi:transporter substrate-binding domain-containing protein [Pseudomonas sp. nanlin1]|uniref:transporter substrate-binding domain-containing protein n=1 Tax=Pseudomonas sp. nanlin1 TaxID=3040605 RepID=UPI00388F5EE5
MKTLSTMAVLFVSAWLTSPVVAAEAPLRTAVDATFAPHAMPNLDGGLQGFNIDMGNAVAQQMGRTLNIEAAEFSGLIPGLNAKRYDFILAPVTVTEERSQALLFSEAYLDTDYTFVQKKGAAPLTTLDALKGMKVSVNKGSNYEGWARANAEKYAFNFDVYGTTADAIQAVLSGRADTNLSGNTVAGYAAKRNPLLQTSYTIKTGAVWALAFRHNDEDGREAVSRAVKCLKQNGTLAKLAQKWFGFTPGAESAAVKVSPGYGVPGMPGYRDTPVTLDCRV